MRKHRYLRRPTCLQVGAELVFGAKGPSVCWALHAEFNCIHNRLLVAELQCELQLPRRVAGDQR